MWRGSMWRLLLACGIPEALAASGEGVRVAPEVNVTDMRSTALRHRGKRLAVGGLE